MNNLEIPRGGTMCLSKAGLVVGSTATKAQIVAPNGAGVDFAIDGVLYHKADTDDSILFTGHTVTKLYTKLFLVCLSATLVVTVTASSEVLITEYEAGNAVLKWPEPTADTCPIGAIKIAATTAVFTGATTSLGTGNTATYYDIAAVPPEPMTAAND
jgi:hypothetical protein